MKYAKVAYHVERVPRISQNNKHNYLEDSNRHQRIFAETRGGIFNPEGVKNATKGKEFRNRSVGIPCEDSCRIFSCRVCLFEGQSRVCAGGPEESAA